MGEIRPLTALVRPRVESANSGETLLLGDAIEPFVQRGRPGALCLWGLEGSGKSTALAHLAAALPGGALTVLLDDPEPGHVTELHDRMLVLYAAPTQLDFPHLATFRLAPWGRDEALEYLMAAHPARCASVMSRVRKWGHRDRPDSPELWRIALDAMAGDESIGGPDEGLERHLDRRFRGVFGRKAAALCLNRTVKPAGQEISELRLLGHRGFLGFLLGRGLSREDLRLLRHPRVERLMAARGLAEQLRKRRKVPALEGRLPRELVRTAGREAAKHPKALAHLESRLLPRPASQAMAASLLHYADRGWRPDRGPARQFQGAWFTGAGWPKLRLEHACLKEADLTGANLADSDLSGALLARACLRGAHLRGSRLRGVLAYSTELSGANLSGVDAEGSTLIGADLSNSDCEGAKFRDAWLVGADLRGASFRRADLRESVWGEPRVKDDVHWTEHPEMRARMLRFAQRAAETLRRTFAADLPSLAALWCAPREPARLEGADFSCADISRARLVGCDLRETVLAGARLDHADLYGANLEGLRLPHAGFRGANLENTVLTGTAMSVADLREVRLCGARLADVHWERADLRDADFRGATFHLGSSRSGLLFGEPSEGTRSGFYTDEYFDQSYRSPEEIRVADLMGADLRGARVLDADFYLVDLRGATFEPDQEEHFRRCGAILGTRV